MDLDGIVEAFFRDGYARVGKCFDEAYLETLRVRTDALMRGEIVHEGLFFQHDSASGRYEDLEIKKGYVGPSLDYRKLEKLERDPLFAAHINAPVFERIVGAFIDGPVSIYRAVLFNKSARGGSPIPWHQDAGRLWGVDRDPFLQIWTALDDASADGGCLEVIPGSHHGGLVTPLGGVIPDAVAATRAQEGVLLPARAGEVLLVHNLVWHRSSANQSGRPRRALTVCYMTAQTRCVRTRRAPRAFVRVFER